MPQVLKPDVRERITTAALEVFAQRGYAGATMGEIAAGAAISTGNVYRYFSGKEELFDAVVSPAFVRRFRSLLRRRVRAVRGVSTPSWRSSSTGASTWRRPATGWSCSRGRVRGARCGTTAWS